jgi:NAD(P) transhydrogenase subunit alpha
MRIAIPTEIHQGETRVAATPETIKKLRAGYSSTVMVQAGAGAGANISDQEFEAAGATMVETAADVYAQAEVLLKVRGPDACELSMLHPGTTVIGLLAPHDRARLDALAARGVTAFALERLPRITRAQTMDVLSSQANIAGYKAAVLAANEYGRFMPMLMTAAGTVKAARVLVLGAGVAGLQAIATAKRLGAVIEAFDVRPATKEQVESLGAKFIEVPTSDEERRLAETAGGYAREVSEDYQRRQTALIDERARAADIIITTALVPGRPAPILLREDTIRSMKRGAVVVDLAIEQGGNCPLTEKDRIVVRHGVTLIGYSNLPAMLAADASALYARNVLAFLNLLLEPKSGAININRDDEIIAGALVCADGRVVTHNP